MPPLTSLLCFVLPYSTLAFASLRHSLISRKLVDFQYYGYTLPDEGYLVPRVADEICWLIQWTEKADSNARRDVARELQKMLDVDTTISELRFRFTETFDGGLERALQAPITQFAVIALDSKAPLDSPDLQASMHKTFADCYLAPGFRGGGWGYALNTNDVKGKIVDVDNDLTGEYRDEEEEKELNREERRLGIYPLGWESLDTHHAYSKTELFKEEIKKLQGWFRKGTGAWFVSFQEDWPGMHM